jgi:hypothetical protein
MTDLSPAARAAVLKALADLILTAGRDARDEADADLLAAYTADGVTAKEIRLPGVDRPVAKLSLSPGKTGLLLNEEALLAWCRVHAPTEVVEEKVVVAASVRPAYVAALTARLQVGEGGRVFDPDTGDVVPFARVVPAGAPRIAMTFPAGGRGAIAGAYRDGALTLPQVLALTAGPTGKDPA